ncbi:MAG: hypothetical protein RL522_2276 [Pseudomonadota bacterium]|jgi:hypothetical protein
MMRVASWSTAQAQARYERLPSALRIASLSPAFAAADTRRDPRLRCVHAVLEEGGAEWMHSVHLLPLAGHEGEWGATSPYGYGGPITTSDDPAFLAQAWSAWQAWCRQEGVLAEFCRFHPHAPGALRAFSGRVQENRQTVSVDLTVADVAAGFNSLTRRKIRRTQQAGVQARWSRDPADWARYGPFYRQAMQDIQATPFYFFPDAYFEALAPLPCAHLLVCEHEDRWLSAGVYLLEGGVLEYHLGASSPEGKETGTPSLLQAEAAAWGQAQGAHSLYLAGGTDTSADNPLLFYKLGFSRRTLPFSVGQAVHDDNRYWAAAARLGFSPDRPPPRLLLD